MFATKQQKNLVSPPFKIREDFYMSHSEITAKKMKDVATLRDMQNYSNFFMPGVVNIFTDAAKSNDIRKIAALGNAITYFTDKVVCNLSPAMFLDDVSVNEAELNSIWYGLICYVENKIPCDQINIFTDSVVAVRSLRRYFEVINQCFLRKDLLDGYLFSLNRDRVVSELEYYICYERSKIQCPVNIFHIKGHSKDLLNISTVFKHLNGINITIQDAIELTNYNALVDSKVNKVIRCPMETVLV